MTVELRDRVIRLESKMEAVESVPRKIVELETSFHHMKNTLDDIRLQGMEQGRREDAHYSRMIELVEANHTKLMSRIGHVEKKQNTIFSSFNAAVFCGALVIGGIYLWFNIFSPNLNDKISHISSETVEKSLVETVPGRSGQNSTGLTRQPISGSE